MNLASAIRDARQTRQVERARVQVVNRYHETTGETYPRRLAGLAVLFVAMPAFYLAPLLVPIFVWLGPEDARAPRFAALVAVLVLGGHRFQAGALRFTANDVLREPSKAGVLLLRLWRQLPMQLLTGAAWAGAYAILLGEALTRDPPHAVLLLLAIVVSPVTWTLGNVRRRLLGSDFAVLGPLVVPVAAAVCLAGVGDPSFGWVDVTLCVVLTAAGASVLVRLAMTWVRRPRLHWHIVGVELATLPRFAVALGLLLPAAVLRDPAVLRPAAWTALPLVLLVAAYTLTRLVRAVRYAEENTRGSTIQSVDANAPLDDRRRRDLMRVVLPETHAGRRSLVRAALYLYRRSFWFRRGELATPLRFARRLPRLLPMALYHGWGVLLATLAVLSPVGSNVATTLAILAASTAPSFVTGRLSWTLHRLGVDYLEQVRHNLRGLALFAVLPTLLAADLAGTLAGWSSERALVVAVLCAVFALRAGWRGFLGSERTTAYEGKVGLAAVGVMAASLWLPLASWWTASAALALGLVGVIRRVRRWDERALADEVRQLEEQLG